jgi:hypothetical protein
MEELSHDVKHLVSTFLADLDNPVSLSCQLMLESEDWVGLAGKTVDPRSYLDAKEFVKDSAAVAILKKCPQLPTSPDVRRLNAVEKWLQGERSCYWANERLCKYLPEFSNFGDVDAAVTRHLSAIRKIVRNLIGYAPPLLTEGRFGPGATFSDRGRFTTLPDKMSTNPTLTRGAIWYLPQWLGTQWGADFCARHGEFQFVPGNRYATVPKTALTDRSIASEPSINVFYQLGLGKSLRQRLRSPSQDSLGWDLNVAQDIHRRIACMSSVTREFATLDLSNASDTVAYNLVKLLLPRPWFEALDSLRSPKTHVDGKWVKLEKFSSMGNGFTFELETVIFAALAIHASRCAGFPGILGSDVFVFGDDIILPDGAVFEISPLLAFCGFEVNSEKSYFGGVPFRESCGGDYFDGVPVRGYYLKGELNEPQEIISYANGVKALYHRVHAAGGSCRHRSWVRSLDLLPLSVRRARGPAALGDIVIHDEEKHWDVKWRHGIRYLRALKPAKRRLVAFANFRPGVVLACATYGSGNEGTPVHGRPLSVEGVIPRDGLLGYKVGWVPWS